MFEVRHTVSPSESAALDSAERRAAYLVDDLFRTDDVRLVYSHEDRMIVGGVSPEPGEPVPLNCPDQLRTTTFCERREVGIINIGEAGTVRVGDDSYSLGPRDCLYVGRGSAAITFLSEQPGRARFYVVSTSAHREYPTALIRAADIPGAPLGTTGNANVRTLRKYIHADGVRSCELVMGLTSLAPGSVWNTMPAHTHDRRTEVYLYCDVEEDARVIHLMGEPNQVRTIVVADREAVIAPSWSIHCGAGTSAYTFVWAMGGENQSFDDMDTIAIPELR